MKVIDNTHLNMMLSTQNEQIKNLNKIVSDSIQEVELILQNLSTRIEEDIKQGDRISDKVASFGGSLMFITLLVLCLFSGLY